MDKAWLLVLWACVACAGDEWVSFASFSDGASYVPLAGVDGVSGSLPKGWRDGSSWSGSKVRYAFRREGQQGYLRAEVRGEGMCQFATAEIPALDRLTCFNMVVRARSVAGSEVLMGVRDSEGDHAYSVMAKVALSPEWREYELPVSGGPSAPKSEFQVEMFSPGALDLAWVRMVRVPAERYRPVPAQAVPREDAEWLERSRGLVEAAVRAQPAFVLMGDSITQRWEQDGRAVWDARIAPLGAANFGVDGDGTEHLLWRIQNSGLGTRFKPRLAALLIGINDIGAGFLPNDVVLGLTACVRAIRSQSPETKVLILGVFPSAQRGDDGVRETIRAVNKGYAALADGQHVYFADIGGVFLERDGSIASSTMVDFLHLTAKGYGLYARELVPVVRAVLAK